MRRSPSEDQSPIQPMQLFRDQPSQQPAASLDFDSEVSLQSASDAVDSSDSESTTSPPLNGELISKIPDFAPQLEPESPDEIIVDAPDDRLDFFFSMIESLYPILTNNLPPNPPPHLPPRPTVKQQLENAKATFINVVLADGDKLNPFRRLGPSLSHILAVNGPYSVANLRTPSGLFSALIFRGVIHHTQYLADGHPVYFENLAAWNRTYARINKENKNLDKKYFCLTNAYGVPTKARSVTNTPRYWEQANDPKFNFFLNTSKPTNIVVLFNYFRKGWLYKDKKRVPGSNQRFPAFGDLTLLQLLVDYAEAGVVTRPTAEEMAYMIEKVNAGGLTGLIDLGLVKSEKSSVKSITAALQVIQSHSLTRIPARIRSLAAFDFIFFEHALCKHRRLKEDFAPLYKLLKT